MSLESQKASSFYSNSVEIAKREILNFLSCSSSLV